MVSDDVPPIVYVDHIGEGTLLGEIAFLFNMPRTASVRTKTYTDIFKMTRDDVDRLLENFPELRRDMETIATARLEEDDKIRNNQDSDEMRRKREQEAIEADRWAAKRAEISARRRNELKHSPRRLACFDHLYERTYSAAKPPLSYYRRFDVALRYVSVYVMFWQAFMRAYDDVTLMAFNALADVTFAFDILLHLRLRFVDERGMEVNGYDKVQ